MKVKIVIEGELVDESPCEETLRSLRNGVKSWLEDSDGPLCIGFFHDSISVVEDRLMSTYGRYSTPGTQTNEGHAECPSCHTCFVPKGAHTLGRETCFQCPSCGASLVIAKIVLARQWVVMEKEAYNNIPKV